MPELALQPLAYRVVRYFPNLIRDEWINVGVLVLDPASGRVGRRFLEDPADFGRLRRLHPTVDEELLRHLTELFETPLARERGGLAYIEYLEQTLSNGVQLGPSKGLLAEDVETELDRLYREQVEPPRYSRAAEDLSSRGGIRNRANQVFRTTGIWPRLERRLRVDEFTFAGDPLRIDYSYRRNGTRGFVQALPLNRDPGQAKVLAFTADAIRAKLEKTEFLAVTETEAHPEDSARHRFVTGLLAEHEIPVVPLARLAEWAYRLRPMLTGNGHN